MMLGKIEGRGKGDDRGWDGWMASPTQWTWVWLDSRSWWWTGRPGVLWFMGLQRVRHDWTTLLNWTDTYITFSIYTNYLIKCLKVNESLRKFKSESRVNFENIFMWIHFFRLNTWFKVLTYSLKELGFSTLKIFFHQTIAFDIHCNSQNPPGTAAAAKSLQSCLTLCDPRDSSPPGTANQRQTF